MLKIKTLITSLCSLIISDSVAVEIFAISQPGAKTFRKLRCATFFETRCRKGQISNNKKIVVVEMFWAKSPKIVCLRKGIM